MYRKIAYIRASCLMLTVTAIGNTLIEIQQITQAICCFLLIIIVIINKVSLCRCGSAVWFV